MLVTGNWMMKNFLKWVNCVIPIPYLTFKKIATSKHNVQLNSPHINA